MATKRRGADLTDVRVARLVEKWRARLLTSEWVIGVRVLDDLKAVAHEDGDDELVDAYAYTQVEEAYFSARMTFNASRLRGRGEAFLDLVACHEVLHCVLATQEHGAIGRGGGGQLARSGWCRGVSGGWLRAVHRQAAAE
jgi:hypothetical protein